MGIEFGTSPLRGRGITNRATRWWIAWNVKSKSFLTRFEILHDADIYAYIVYASWYDQDDTDITYMSRTTDVADSEPKPMADGDISTVILNYAFCRLTLHILLSRHFCKSSFWFRRQQIFSKFFVGKRGMPMKTMVVTCKGRGSCELYVSSKVRTLEHSLKKC